MSSFLSRVRVTVRSQTGSPSQAQVPGDALSAFLPEDAMTSDWPPLVPPAPPPAPPPTPTPPASIAMRARSEAPATEIERYRPDVPSVPDSDERGSNRTLLVAAATLLVVSFVAALLFQMRGSSIQALTAPTGRLVIDTRPAGAEVQLNGEGRGLTPLTLDVPPGPYTLVVTHAGRSRTLPVQIAAGSAIAHHLEFAEEVAAPAAVGHLSIVTDPPGARVVVNGEQVGRAPLTVSDLAVSSHQILVVGDFGSVERQVSVVPGTTTSVVFALPAAPPTTGGWVALVAPFPVEVAANGEVVGTNASPRIMMRAGRYELTLRNDELGFSDVRKVEVQAGQTATLSIDASAAISVNARPWADVIVDGAQIGQTPIANHSVSLGVHDIVFRHPSLGERRQQVVVTARGPNRVSVDMTK